MANTIWVKTSANTWSQAKAFYAKTGSSTWKTGVFPHVKTSGGWRHYHVYNGSDKKGVVSATCVSDGYTFVTNYCSSVGCTSGSTTKSNITPALGHITLRDYKITTGYELIINYVVVNLGNRSSLPSGAKFKLVTSSGTVVLEKNATILGTQYEYKDEIKWSECNGYYNQTLYLRLYPNCCSDYYFNICMLSSSSSGFTKL